jgi:hypothetical protein
MAVPKGLEFYPARRREPPVWLNAFKVDFLCQGGFLTPHACVLMVARSGTTVEETHKSKNIQFCAFSVHLPDRFFSGQVKIMAVSLGCLGQAGFPLDKI